MSTAPRKTTASGANCRTRASQCSSMSSLAISRSALAWARSASCPAGNGGGSSGGHVERDGDEDRERGGGRQEPRGPWMSLARVSSLLMAEACTRAPLPARGGSGAGALKPRAAWRSRARSSSAAKSLLEQAQGGFRPPVVRSLVGQIGDDFPRAWMRPPPAAGASACGLSCPAVRFRGCASARQ